MTTLKTPVPVRASCARCGSERTVLVLVRSRESLPETVERACGACGEHRQFRVLGRDE